MDHAHRRRGTGRRKPSECKPDGECRREGSRESAGERERERTGGKVLPEGREEIAGESLQGSDD